MFAFTLILGSLLPILAPVLVAIVADMNQTAFDRTFLAGRVS